MAHEHEDHQQRPLAGAVVCWTSIGPEQRSAMADWVLEMGATPKLDLTSDVTHLIVGAIDTPKYKYVAKERPDIKVLTPEWLMALRKAWMAGDEFNSEELHTKHRLPTLEKLRICVTGFDNLQQRTSMTEIIRANGAEYHGDLTRAITHLIAAAPQGKKYEFAGQWGIKVVSFKWLEDSLKRGMALDESLYHPTIPVAEQGAGATVERKTDVGNPEKKRKGEEVLDRQGKRKLRRTASSRLGSQHENFWAEMGNEKSSAHEDLLTHGLDVSNDKDGQQVPRNDEAGIDLGDSILMQKDADSASTLVGEDTANEADVSPLSSRSYFITGFDNHRKSRLEDYLTRINAKLLTEEEFQSALQSTSTKPILIYPHDKSFDEFLSLYPGFPLQHAEIATEIWIEKCIYAKSLVRKECPLYEPLRHLCTDADIKALTICPTSFTGIDLLHFAKAVKLIGATYEETLLPKTSVLVAKGVPSSRKLRYALMKSIPVVKEEWFWKCLVSGQLEPYGPFLLPYPKTSSASKDPETQNPTADAMSREGYGPWNQSNSTHDNSRCEGQQNRSNAVGNSADQDPSLPLQESKSSGNTSSPRKKPKDDQDKRSTTDESLKSSVASKDGDSLSAQESTAKPSLRETIASLLPSRRPQAVNSVITTGSAQAGLPSRLDPVAKRTRTLGRAPSHPNGTHSFGGRSAASPLDSHGDTIPDDGTQKTEEQPYEPTQRITYAGQADAGDEGRAREVVARIGVVKDARDVAAKGVAGRVGKRRTGEGANKEEEEKSFWD